jgi:hypothetical protein
MTRGRLIEMGKQGTRHWNYRLIKHPATEVDEEYYGLHEVHYLDGEVDSWTERAIVVGSSVKSITDQLLVMRVDAKNRAVLIEPKAA